MKSDEVITTASEPSPSGDGPGVARDGLASRAAGHKSAATDRPGLEALREAHAGNWKLLDARAAAAERGEATLTRGEMIMLARRDERRGLGKRGRPKGMSWKTAEQRVRRSERLADLQRGGMSRKNALAAVATEFRVSEKAVEEAELLFKSYARLEHRIKDFDLDAVERGHCPPLVCDAPKRKPDTEADHLAALYRMKNKSGR